MAQKVYDQEDESPVTGPKLRKLEGSPETSAENLDRIPTMSDEEGKELDKKRGLSSENQESEDGAEDAERPENEEPDAAQKLRNEWQKAKAGDKAAGKSLYNKKNLISTWRDRRRLLVVGGIGVTLIIGTIVGLFSFLNIFKLDDIMSNIDARSFSRLNGVQDRRSLSWMEAYMEARMLDIGDHPDLSKGNKSDNILFRSENVSTANSRFLNWYRTMRASNFETDLLQKDGIKFTSVLVPNGTGGYKVRAGVININGETPVDINLTSDQISGIEKGDIKTFNQLQDYFDVKTFGSDAEARSAIKDAVQKNTFFFQVFKRRQLRKDIQSMVGVRSWTFFEKTNNAYKEKKIEIRNKIISAAIPADTLSGKFVRCLFGISDCNFNSDPSAPENGDTAALAGDSNPDNTSKPVNGENGKPITGTAVDLGDAASFIKNVISKVAPGLNAINIVSTIDTLSRVNSAIESGKISQGVAVARGIQAMGLYQVFETARDQLKTGQVSSQEVGQFMQVLGPIAASEGWTKVVNGKGDPSTLTRTTASNSYCSSKSQAELEANSNLVSTNPAFSFAYLCPDKQIGGASNAATLENTYKSTIGAVISPVLDAYNGFRNNSFFGPVVGFFEGIVSQFSSILNTLIIEPILKLTGLSGDINSAVQWMVGKMATFLGAGPILDGKEPAGVMMNWLMQGGAYSAEAATRANGGSATSPLSMAASEVALNGYEQTQQSQESLASRLFSTSDPGSPASKALIAISQFRFSSISDDLMSFGSLLKTIGAGITAPFSRASLADVNNGYNAANFAGIQTYDFPSQCYTLDPISAQPMDGTNAMQIFQANGITPSGADLTSLQSWDTEDNSTDFYATIYRIIDNSSSQNKQNDGTIAQQIYNCNLLDNSVSGSLGNVYGYTSDNGLN